MQLALNILLKEDPLNILYITLTLDVKRAQCVSILFITLRKKCLTSLLFTFYLLSF
jgi:hypothetical protein